MLEDKEIKLSDELEQSLKDIIKSCENEDREIRKSMVRQWKKSEEFWHGVQYLFWSESDESWHSPLEMNWSDDFGDDEEKEELGSFSDKVVDIYKAHGESIISALSAQIPGLRWLPDDADSTEDCTTVKTYNKIGDLVQRHNKAKLLFLRALFFLANHGIVASYRYQESDEKYGTIKVPVYGEEERDVVEFVCSNCGYSSDEDWTGEPLNSNAAATQSCPQCQSTEPPQQEQSKQKVPVLISEEDRPKSRVKLDIFGALHFKVSIFARNQSECSYFGLFLDQGKDTACENYPDLYEEIQNDTIDNLDRFARASYNYPTDEEVEKKNLVAVNKWWLRPAAFNRETERSKREKLVKKFPKGCRVIAVGKQKHIANVIEESLDDRWEIGQSGLSTYIYSDAILRPLIQIQEMRNQLVNLIIETIEHGIPSEFARPDVVNFSTYSRYEAVPGYLYKALPGRPGEKLADAFYTSNRATLSREVAMFLKQLDQDAQFAIGSFPSIYGGPSEGKSRTFAEYAASRQMALQRLSIVWQLITDWWTRTVAGCVKLYASCLVEDEKFTKFESGNYVNVWIKRSEMLGKVGGVEPEASETFPISMAQKKDLILKLMEMNNQFVNAALYAPENARIIQEILALTEFKLPGEAQRIKQVIEINEMLADENNEVQIDPQVDDDAVHISTLKSFMADLPGLDVKRDNPRGYAKLALHLQEHEMNLMKKTMSMAGGSPAGVPPETAHAGVED